ncbi:unnamed protein product [Caenorhabditis brenneri]
MLKLFFFTLLLTLNHCFVLDSLTALNNQYPVGKNSRIYLISAGTTEQLREVQVMTMNSKEIRNGTNLTTPTAIGSLNPFIPSEDNDQLIVTVPVNLTGWLYITEETDLNVYAMSQNSSTINFQPGTNLFFNLYFPATGTMPIAKNVVISNSVSFRGYVGVPEENGVKFFDSSSISDLTTYDSLQIAMQIFHFKSKGIDVKYEISYDIRAGFSTQSSGLLMTRAFPIQYSRLTQVYDVDNRYNDNITLYMVTRFDNTKLYYITIRLSYSDKTPDQVFQMNSTSDTVIQSISPFATIKIVPQGPFAIQYRLQNANPKPTTPAYQTTTQAGNRWGILFLVAVVLTRLREA